MKNICLKIAYDGTPFYGWQKTDAGPSVEGTLQNILEQILQEPIELQAASRTDRGVHAENQVVNFFTTKKPPSQLSLNRLLPRSIRVLEVKTMPDHFHPTLDTKGKLYVYSICYGPLQMPFHRFFSWHVPYALDSEAMQEAANYFLGEHDFSAFCNVHENLNYPHKMRTIDSITLMHSPNRLQIAIKGNHFLYKMARIIVGTLVHVGRGKLKASSIQEIIASKQRPHAGITAPAHGLSLKEIYF